MGTFPTAVCSLPLHALRSFRVRKLQTVTPGKMPDFYALCHELRIFLFLVCAPAAQAHPFALVRKDAKHAQRGEPITAQHGCLMLPPSALPQESSQRYFASVGAGWFSLYERNFCLCASEAIKLQF